MYNAHLLPILKRTKLVRRHPMPNRSIRLCTGCTKDGKKSKKSKSFWAEVKKHQIKWGNLTWPARKALRTQAGSDSNNKNWKMNRSMLRLWFWMLTWATKLTESLCTEKTNKILRRSPSSSPGSMTWMTKANRNFCSCWRWSCTMYLRKLTKINRLMAKNTQMKMTDSSQLNPLM